VLQIDSRTVAEKQPIVRLCLEQHYSILTVAIFPGQK